MTLYSTLIRYSTLFTHDRLSVADTLRRYVDEEEMVRRIIFIAATEAFHAAKLAFRSFEARTRKLLLPIHSGPETLEEAVADYIVRLVCSKPSLWSTLKFRNLDSREPCAEFLSNLGNLYI